MSWYLGIDTSNYTTSAALFNSETNEVISKKKLLPVKQGAVGLKQSDAVFAHIKQLNEVLDELYSQAGFKAVKAVGFSATPRDAEGSYMPCFLVGSTVAKAVATANNIRYTAFSHQRGHIAAALYSAGRLDLVNEKFIAFHISGGTTDCLLVEPCREKIFNVTELSSSMDLKAGQAVDRVGNMLGLPFPAGPYLEKLALKSQAKFKIKPVIRNGSCSLSGVENKCRKMLDDGVPHEDVALYCIEFIKAAIDEMLKVQLENHVGLPIVFSGGVMSNTIIKEYFTKKHGAFFASPEFSSDNAAGIAIMTGLKSRL